MANPPVPTVRLPDQPEAGPSTGLTSRDPSPHGSRLIPAQHGRLSKLMVPGRSRSGSGASQSEAPITAYAEDGAASSGRSTPEQRRRTGKAAAASLLASDAKYKKFAAQVDKCLQSFESVNEWADFISFLSRLLKTLQAWSTYTEIPRKLIVSKRLAQCLNPALPSGVHQRALDVYAHIFGSIGVEGLRRDMLIWSSGLFPFFQFASTSVRPQIINIFQNFYLPLGEDLRPATKAIVLALLPGMEEETGDFFDKILSFFRQLSRAVSEPFFLQTILLVLISSSASRLSALNYLAKGLQKPPDPSLGIENGLIIRGVAAVLGDENVLVRRNGLDLLLRTLRIHDTVFKEASSSERTMLVRVAIGVVLQREISLSRRVYTWLLGPDESTEKQLEYFRENGLELLVKTLQTDMETEVSEKDPTDVQRPFKIFLSLLDRWEIGSSLSERLAIPALRAMQRLIQSNEDQRDELLMTAAAVYEAIEPVVIWKQLYRLIEQNLRESDVDDPTLWILDNILQKDEETVSVHAPAILDAVLSWLQAGEIRADVASQSLALCTALLKTIPSKLLANSDTEISKSDPLAATIYQTTSSEDWLKRIPAETIPRIVKSIFTLTSKDFDTNNMLSILNVQSAIIDAEASTIQALDSTQWLESLLRRVSSGSVFPLLEAISSLILRARHSSLFSPPIDLSNHHTMMTILDALFSYLRPDAAPYHARCVELLWEYNALAEIHALEDVISARMSSTHMSTALQTFEAFGVLWRMTEDSMLPGELFNVALFKILDALKQTGPLQWAAEGWMRNYVGSYFRALDPILLRLLDPDSQVADVSLRGITEADTSMIFYLLESLKTLVNFGGKAFNRACSTSDITKSPYSQLVEHVQSSGLVRRAMLTIDFPGTANHLDLTVRISLRHLEPPSLSKPRSGHILTQIESTSLSILQKLADHGDLSRSTSTRIKQALIQRLSIAVQQSHSTLQPQMLDLLKGLISTSPNLNQARTHRRGPSNPEKAAAGSPSLDSAKDLDNMMVDLVTRAISSHSVYPVLRQWTEFVLVLTSRLQSRADLLHKLAEAFSQELSSTMLHLEQAYRNGERYIMTQEEPSLLLVSLERLVTLSMSLNPHRKSEDGRGPNENGGILGLMSGVFVADGPTNEKIPTNDETYFEDFVRSLLITWTIIGRPVSAGPAALSSTQCYSTIRSRAQAVLERTFKSYPLTLVEGLTAIWAENNTTVADTAIFDCIDLLTPSAQKVVELLNDSINHQLRRGSDMEPLFAALAFLQGYISRLEAPIAVQVWNASFGFAREMLASNTASNSRALLYPVLRCLTTLSKTVANTSALEDRRLRRDLQEVFGKLLEVVVGSVPRLGESKAWQRRNMTEPPLLVTEIQTFLAEQILPNLRSFLHDADRVASACASISSAVVSPAFRQNKRAPPTILRILYEMTRIPSAVKAWRLPIFEAFNDGRFFKQSPDEAEAWRPLVCALMDNDKDRLVEMLARITAAPSANIFANREQETITRSLNLRRLSFVLFAAEVNHYLTDLPAIQEALVDILRTSVVSPRVHSEVYRCLRVLMCRFGAQHLTNFWPVILAELFRGFEGIMDEIPPPDSESLHLILAACKFLDLLLVIQSEDFQMHQWMFVTDTTDAVYPPEDFTPEAIMDRLAEIMLEHSHLTDKAPALLIGAEGSSARRPRLASVQNISSLSQLAPFFNRASIDTYEGVYANEGVDWEAVEDGLNGEIFDERV